MSDYIDGNVSNLIIQYADKPKAVSTITAITEEFEEIYDTANLFADAFDVDSAVGKQLDIIGKIVGISRVVKFAVPKTYFGFSDNILSYPMGNKFNTLVSYPFKNKFEFPYTDGTLNDYNYRLFIKAKIIKNYTTSANISSDNLAIQNAFDFVFSGKAYVVDNKDMSLDIYIDYGFDLNLLLYIQRAELLPRPQGVRYNTYINYLEGKTFGWNANNLGFGDKFSGGFDSHFASKIIFE